MLGCTIVLGGTIVLGCTIVLGGTIVLGCTIVLGGTATGMCSREVDWAYCVLMQFLI